jgi:hypothetical protein
MIAARLHRRRMTTRPRPEPGAGARRGDVIPYDYGATFPITGRPGNVVQSVINTAPDSLFVAVAVGYGFEEDRGRALSFKPEAQGDDLSVGTVRLGDITLGELPQSALIEGFRVNPRFENQVFGFDPAEQNGVAPRGRERAFSDDPVPAALLTNDSFFQRITSPAQISFLLSMLDSGSGRELQDEPVHNIASLGKSNGERPFRLLAQPITFLPRTTIRLQIVERSQDVHGKLFVVFYGYQIVGSSGCPELLMRKLKGPPGCLTETIGSPSARVIPFDYVTTFELTGRPQTQLESETTVNAEGGFVATSIGYGLLVGQSKVAIEWSRASEVKNETLRAPLEKIAADFQKWLSAPKKVAPPPLINLANVPLRLLTTSALTDGIRIKRDHVRIAFENNGHLASDLPVTWLDDIFERLNTPEDVSFRYSIYDSGRGRDLQNQPLHNIAGLGIADGDRPFKKLARSMVFLPRSTIRVRVEERFGRGTLFVVLQGYKFLSTPTPGAQR